MLYNNITEAVGKTPLIKLNNIKNGLQLCAELYAKVEGVNIAGSIKDRVAAEILSDAEKSGSLKAGATLIEPTSGNTGIGLAAMAAAKGYRMIIVMPDSMSIERRQLIAAYGAELVLTDGAKGMTGAIEKAEELQKAIEGSIICGQFTNPANPAAHYKTTGMEIWQDLDGKVDVLVAGVGTGGTITGTGRYLKEQNSAVKVVAVEPATSAILSGGKAGGHKLQGIGAGFVPAVLDTSVYDEVLPISDEEGYAFARLLAKKEGILSGVSSGGALAAAVKVAARKENEGKNIVVILPDNGDKYLSCGLFEI